MHERSPCRTVACSTVSPGSSGATKVTISPLVDESAPSPCLIVQATSTFSSTVRRERSRGMQRKALSERTFTTAEAGEITAA